MKLSMLSEAADYWKGQEGYTYWRGQWMPKKPARARRTSKTDRLLLQMAKDGKDKPDADALDPYQRFLGEELKRLLQFPQFKKRMLKANSTWVN